MISKVQVQNYKSLRDVTIDLGRFTIFVGANGSGKTSILEAIRDAARAVSRHISQEPQKVLAETYTRGAVEDMLIRCWTEVGEFRVEWTPPNASSSPPDSLQNNWFFRSTPQTLQMDEQDDGIRKFARNFTFLQLSAALMSLSSYSDESPPGMENSGEGLASVLAFMALNDPQSFEELVVKAKTLIPRLQRIRFMKTPVIRTEREIVRIGEDVVNRSTQRTYQGELILLDFDHAKNISVRTASEGTILMLGLLAVLLGPIRPRVLLLDDIEHGLHPLAQKQLVEVIRQILVKFPDLQILATAHSPYLLNYLSPEEVRIVAAGDDGYTRCGRLEDHPKFATWKDELDPGEMWSLFGEKWVLEKEAAK